LNIATGYLVVKSRKSIGRKENAKERSFLIRNILVSLSNVLCWIAVVPLSVMSIMGYQINSSVLAWVVVVGLPVNSILNPIVYTFTTSTFRNLMKPTNLTSMNA